MKVTNEIGYILSPAAAEVIITQFRKFMGLTAFELMSQWKLKQNSSGQRNLFEQNIEPIW